MSPEYEKFLRDRETLRAILAGLCLAGMLASPSESFDMEIEKLSKLAVFQSDTLLADLDKPKTD